jgi:hypothetical protein
MGLSNKHLAFIDNYFLYGMNATEAYCHTYPKASRETARRNGSILLTNTDIAAEISHRLKEKQMSADEVLIRLGEQARADMSEFLEFKDGIKTPFLDLKSANDKGLLRLVKKFKYNAAGQPEIELHDAQAALLNIGKQHGLFSDRHVVEMRLEKEIDSILDTLEGILPPELYSNVLAAISGPETGGETSTESPSTEVE